jgi:hypothetical protein
MKEIIFDILKYLAAFFAGYGVYGFIFDRFFYKKRIKELDETITRLENKYNKCGLAKPLLRQWGTKEEDEAWKEL